MKTGLPVIHSRVVKGSGGGPDKTILESARFLNGRGWPSRCLYLRHPADRDFGKLMVKARNRDVELIPIDDSGPLDVGVIARVRASIPEGRFLWHGHDYKTNLLGLLLGRGQQPELITTVHGWVHRTLRTTLYYAIDRFCLRRYQRVLCVSEDLLEACLAAGVPADRCWLIPNAIDTDEYRRVHNREEARDRLGLTTDRFVIGGVGRLSPEKGFNFLIDAVASLTRDKHDVELWIIGEGAEEEALRRQAQDLGIGERVHLLGFHGDVKSYYEAMDAFVISSLREGLPNVLLEAMSMRVPVVSTRIAGIPSIIVDGENGLLVEPGSSEQISAALQRLLTHRDVTAKLLDRARETIEQRFSFSARMEKVLAIYEDLATHKS